MTDEHPRCDRCGDTFLSVKMLALHRSVEHKLPAIVEDVVNLACDMAIASDLPESRADPGLSGSYEAAEMALLAALPTREDVQELREAADMAARPGGALFVDDYAEFFRSLAARIAALLPPED